MAQHDELCIPIDSAELPQAFLDSLSGLRRIEISANNLDQNHRKATLQIVELIKRSPDVQALHIGSRRKGGYGSYLPPFGAKTFVATKLTDFSISPEIILAAFLPLA